MVHPDEKKATIGVVAVFLLVGRDWCCGSLHRPFDVGKSSSTSGAGKVLRSMKHGTIEQAMEAAASGSPCSRPAPLLTGGVARVARALLNEKRGWSIDRLRVRFNLNDESAGEAGVVDHLLRSAFSDVESTGPRTGRNRGLLGTLVTKWWCNGASKQPGRIFMQHTEVGCGGGHANLLTVECNPNPEVMSTSALAAVRGIVESAGGEWLRGTVHRFDSKIDLPCDGCQVVIDDRLRKWKSHGGVKRESQYAGRPGGPLLLRLYDKQIQMLEVHGVEVPGACARFELQVQPGATVTVEDESSGERLRVPEDRSLGGLRDWTYPAPRSRLRWCDPESVSEPWIYFALLAAQVAGVRPVVSMARKRMRGSRVRELVESMPEIPVAELWSSSWPAAIDGMNRRANSEPCGV